MLESNISYRSQKVGACKDVPKSTTIYTNFWKLTRSSSGEPSRAERVRSTHAKYGAVKGSTPSKFIRTCSVLR